MHMSIELIMPVQCAQNQGRLSNVAITQANSVELSPPRIHAWHVSIARFDVQGSK